MFQFVTSWHAYQVRVDVGSACVDIRPSPKTGVLVSFCLNVVCWRHGVAVTEVVVSTKLLYVEPG